MWKILSSLLQLDHSSLRCYGSLKRLRAMPIRFALHRVIHGFDRAEEHDIQDEPVDPMLVFPLELYSMHLPTTAQLVNSNVGCPIRRRSLRPRSNGRHSVRRCPGIVALINLHPTQMPPDPGCHFSDICRGCTVTHSCPVCGAAMCTDKYVQTQHDDLHRRLWEYCSPNIDRMLLGVIPYHREEFLRVVQLLSQRFRWDLIPSHDPRQQLFLTWRRKLALDIHATIMYSEWVRM